MKCWGSGASYGSISDFGNQPSTIGDIIPYFNPGTSVSIKRVSCSHQGLCILLNNGSIKCVGTNRFGESGIGVTTDPIGEKSGHVGDSLPIVNLGTGVRVSSVAAGRSHYCIFTIDKRVKCFGRNFEGQLGLGDRIYRGASSSTMGDNLSYLDFGTNVTITSLHSGSSAAHNCVILSGPIQNAQRIKCWGNNNFFQLGYGDFNTRGDNSGEMGDELPLVDLGIESRVKQLALGGWHTCTLLMNEMVKCYGTGYEGQLASGFQGFLSSTRNILPFVYIDAGKKIKMMSAGGAHTCFVYDDGNTVKCFGRNDNGQLGQNGMWIRGNSPETLIPFIPPIQLGVGSLKISSIYSGEFFNCIIFIDGSVKCFGDNTSGQLGTGSYEWYIGDEAEDMGNKLQNVMLFGTLSPTLPTYMPTSLPTGSPSFSPTQSPTLAPTKKCSYLDVRSCRDDTKCIWIKGENSGACYEFSCSLLNDAECYEYSMECKWDKVNMICKSIKD